MTDDPMDRPVSITLPLAQIYALMDLIGASLAAAQPSPAARNHSDALRTARKNLESAIREQFNDG